MESLDIKLQVFEGPLDLLLHLIDKNKINIYDIPIVSITEQYLEYLRTMQELNMDIMSEFLVMAATLIHIKTKMLLPKEEKVLEEEEEDPRAELVRRLLEYKMYQYAAEELKELQIDAQRVLYKAPTIPEEVSAYEEPLDLDSLLDGLTLTKLHEVFQSVMKRQVDKIDPIRSKFGQIEKEEVRVEEKMEMIREQIRGLSQIRFRALLEVQASKIQVVVTFLAILELMKIGVLTVRQEEIFGDIILDSLEN
ncbi:MAG: segregation/condensation protein A [Firmicutes bacterium]|uniref:Segregation and condensation protein A n=1 Tax=Candidatus Scybalomonas excrementavium TaxID=2840943 RepID=A0A9D9N877_9FIRM|nr:segregation/condensation protein A [Candidatus Scybalomonas excrementavium]